MLETVYGDRIAIVQIDLKPERSSNIHTTWAFDPKTREQLVNIFKERWAEERPSLLQKWDHLRARAKLSETPEPGAKSEWGLVDRARPPVD